MGGGWGVRGGFLFPGTENNLVSRVLCEASCTSHNTFPRKPGEGGIISASRQMREWRFREAELAAQGTRLRQLRTHPDHRREGQVKNWAGHGGRGGGTGGYSQVCRKDT